MYDSQTDIQQSTQLGVHNKACQLHITASAMLYSSEMSWDYLLYCVWVTGLNPKLITSYDAARAAWIFCSITTKIKTHGYVRNSWSSETNHKDQWA